MTTGDELDRALSRLRVRGLSYQALAVVAHEIYGWRLTREQIRRRLIALGIRKHTSGRSTA